VAKQSTHNPKFKGLNVAAAFTSGLYYKTITIVNDDRKWRHNWSITYGHKAKVRAYETFIV
jgi:hypothetical protein